MVMPIDFIIGKNGGACLSRFGDLTVLHIAPDLEAISVGRTQPREGYFVVVVGLVMYVIQTRIADTENISSPT